MFWGLKRSVRSLGRTSMLLWPVGRLGPCRWSWLPPGSWRLRDTNTVSCFWRPDGALVLWFLEPTRRAEPLPNVTQLRILSSYDATVPM